MSQNKLHKLWCDFTWYFSTILGLKAVIHYGVIAFYKGPSWNTKAVIIQSCLDEWSSRRAWYWNQWCFINCSSKTNGTLQLGVGRTGRNPCGAKIQRGSSSSPGRIYIGLAATICTLVAGVAAGPTPRGGALWGMGIYIAHRQEFVCSTSTAKIVSYTSTSLNHLLCEHFCIRRA